MQKTLASGFKAGLANPHADLEDRQRDGNDAKQAATNTEQPERLSNFILFGDEAPKPQMMLIDGVMPLQGLPFIGG